MTYPFKNHKIGVGTILTCYSGLDRLEDKAYLLLARVQYSEEHYEYNSFALNTTYHAQAGSSMLSTYRTAHTSIMLQEHSFDKLIKKINYFFDFVELPKYISV